MAKRQRPTELVVTDFSGQGRDWRVTLPANDPPARDASRRRSSKPVPAYAPRKTKRQKAIDRAERTKQNRKRWHQLHEVELNETKRLLFGALRLLRKNKIELTPEMADALAHHEKWQPGRVGGRRYKKVHKFESE